MNEETPLYTYAVRRFPDKKIALAYINFICNNGGFEELHLLLGLKGKFDRYQKAYSQAKDNDVKSRLLIAQKKYLIGFLDSKFPE